MSFLVCYLSMPSIIRIAHKWGIMDKPSNRKSHRAATPSIGGVGIFLGSVLISLLLIPSADMAQIRFVFAAVTIIFLVGARDDLDPLTPYAKLIGQLIGISLLIFFADIRLTSLYGLFGIYELPLLTSIGLTAILFIYLINSFNLIDGIDALCSSVSILVLSVMGTWFFYVGETTLTILSFSTAGATLAFLKYNISPSKVFMGDTGSLVLGTLCTVLLIQFMEINAAASASTIPAIANVAIALFVLPAFDTFRVFIFRIVRGRSPFLPDQNHVHHLLLKNGLSHMQATSILLIANVGFLAMAFQLQDISPTIFLFLTIVIAYFLTSVLHLSLYIKGRDVLRTDP